MSEIALCICFYGARASIICLLLLQPALAWTKKTFIILHEDWQGIYWKARILLTQWHVYTVLLRKILLFTIIESNYHRRAWDTSILRKLNKCRLEKKCNSPGYQRNTRTRPCKPIAGIQVYLFSINAASKDLTTPWSC